MPELNKTEFMTRGLIMVIVTELVVTFLEMGKHEESW
jgi:hypothetical protein